MPNHPVKVTQTDIVDRARSVCAEGKYVLGQGGRSPSAETPFDPATKGCDCSGFVAWCIGLDRYQRGVIKGDWIETSAIVNDALQPDQHSLFIGIQKDRQPGHIIVYGDRYEWKDVRGGPSEPLKRKRVKVGEGHVGIISEVDSHDRVTKVIHCSLGNYRIYKAAVMETVPAIFFAHNWITVKFKGVEEGGSATR